MNWEAIGAIGEILGALAVVASLVYLAIQIKQSSRIERSRAFQEIFATYDANNHEMFGADNVEIVVAGMRDVSILSGGDRLRFDHLMIGYFNAVESTIFSKGAYLLGDETMENWAHVLQTRFLPYVGVRDWWMEARPIFTIETRDWVEEQIRATDTDSDFLSIK
jgi:hypothetical protein